MLRGVDGLFFPLETDRYNPATQVYYVANFVYEMDELQRKLRSKVARKFALESNN